MKSSWDTTKKRSQYHFDNFATDPQYDTVIRLGHIEPTWLNDVDTIVGQARPATWATRGYKRADADIPSDDLASEQYDISRAGADPDAVITHLNWQIPESLQRISDQFALADCMNRIHVQMPGELWNLHLDKLEKWMPSDPAQVMRIMIQLTDWQPGQFWSYGNFVHQQWRAGNVTTFDWVNVPHATANAGHHPRVTFQITGVATEQTRQFLGQLKDNSFKTR